MVSSAFAVLAASVLVATSEGHSYMSNPMPTWKVGYPTTNYAGLINGQKNLPVPKGMSYGGTPEGNTEAYWTAFNASKFTSLKDLADKTMVLQSLSPFGKATKQCGFSLPTGTPRALPPKVEWVDFGMSHQGPCEVWCDGKRAFMDTNCALHYQTKPAKLPYNIGVCKGAKMMQSYWIALHGDPWQLYLNCVPLSGKVNGTAADTTAGESDSQQTTTDPSTETTDAPTTDTETASASAAGSAPSADTPETSTTDSSAGGSTPEVTPATPTETEATPTATEPTPSTDQGTGAKCSRRRN